jgi:phosphoribosylformylglycinamidine cyclo-ligase
VIDAASAQACAKTLREAGETVYTIGVIAPRGEGAAVEVR